MILLKAGANDLMFSLFTLPFEPLTLMFVNHILQWVRPSGNIHKGTNPNGQELCSDFIRLDR